LYSERLGGEGTTTEKLSLGTPLALFRAGVGVDVLDFSFDDDCEWVGGASTASDLKLVRSRGEPDACFNITIS
jgi:hypothetical protein